MRLVRSCDSTCCRTLSLLVAAALLGCGGQDGPAGPAPALGALRFTELSAGYFHTCALARNGEAYCWGDNRFGTLGDGTSIVRTAPARVATAQTFAALDAGAGHNCALSIAGVAWCWGHNDEGQLGDGTFAGRDMPTPVAGSLTFTSISAGHAHSCGLTATGAAYCWGDDSLGQLGNGGPDGPARSALPVLVSFSQPFAAVVAGYYQSCGLTAGGDAYCWGANESGQNGDGTVVHRHEPVKVQTGRKFTSIAPGDRFVCGVSAEGVLCWGANRFGELGAAAPAGSSVPVEIEGTTSMVATYTSAGTSTIASAEAYACGVQRDRRAVCWGGAIRAFRARTVATTALDDRIRVLQIAAGAEHVCVLNVDGYAFCGGGNYLGQLGDGTEADRSLLVSVAAPQ